MQSLEVLADAALEFANALRARHNRPFAKELAAGVPYSCAACPTAATAGGWKNGTAGWEIGQGGAVFVGPKGGVRETVPVPSMVLEFEAAFDAGMYPALVAGPEAVAA
jgi:hypothetical protein